MKRIILLFLFTVAGFSVRSQTYQRITSKNKTYLETLKGVIYSYQDGVVTLKNNGRYDLGTVSIIAYSKVDSTLFGIALFEEGLERGKTVKTGVYFTAGKGDTEREVTYRQVDEKHLVLSFDKAVRAVR